MELGLRGKVALITGASRGIGKAVAQTLLNEGCAVAICSRGAAQLDATVAELSAKGRAHRRRHRRHRAQAPRKFSSTARSKPSGASTFWSITPARICAAPSKTRRSTSSSARSRDKVFGFFTMIKAVLPIMQRQRDGRIVNIVGQAARHPHPDRFPSGVTNAALMAMNKSVADAVARDNIRVNAVCPQYIESELLASLIEKEMRERGVDRATAAAGFSRVQPARPHRQAGGSGRSSLHTWYPTARVSLPAVR